MYTSNSQAIVPGSPADVLKLLTEPEAIHRWAPIPFDVVQLDEERLQAGSRARVAGRLAGRSVEFDVDVLHATEERLELVADGAISFGVRYVMRPAPAATEVHATVSVEGAGLLGRVLAKATEALLAAGALRISLERIACELQPAIAT
jgi:uncharacterized protein YndB with AHSA1/START domain